MTVIIGFAFGVVSVALSTWLLGGTRSTWLWIGMNALVFMLTGDWVMLGYSLGAGFGLARKP
jgi:hypothetical protein